MKHTALLAAALLSSVAFADKVTLKSGSVLSGTVTGATKAEIVFKSDDFGEVKIPVTNITKLENAGDHTVLYTNNERETKNLAVKDGAYLAGVQPLNMESVKEIDPEIEKWHGSVNVAFNAARGNTVENTGSVMADVTRRWEKDRLKALFGYYYSEKGTADTDLEKSTDRWEAEVQHDHFWFPAVYHYENLRYDRDMIQLLQARYRVGIGAGYQWLENTVFESTGKWNFNQEFGINWVKESYESPDLADDNGEEESKNGYAALRYAHHFTYNPKWNTGLELFHNAEILPNVEEWEKFIAKADVGFTTKLIYDFDLIAKIEWEYNSKPMGNRKNSDIRYIVGVGYKW